MRIVFPTTIVETSAVAPATFTRDDAACYADSARGQYIGCIVIDLACEHGFMPDGENLRDMFQYLFESGQFDSDSWGITFHEWLADREDYHELWDMAENFLNTLCVDGVYFGSSDQGDWGLWEIETEEEENG